MPRRLAPFLFWLALPAVAISLLFVLRAGILAICLYALLLLLALSRAMIFLWERPLLIEREVSDDVVEIGQTVKVSIKLTNPSPWPVLGLRTSFCILR